MATLTHNPESAPHEPTTRIFSRELPNLRNPLVAAEYRRQWPSSTPVLKASVKNWSLGSRFRRMMDGIEG
jgi:hypothetical protein